MYAMVLHTCSRFTAYSSKMTRALEHAVSAIATGDTDLATSPMDKRWEMVRKFEINFTHNQRVRLPDINSFQHELTIWT